jgi:hypothetical protein
MKEDDRLWRLIGRRLAGELTRKESSELEELSRKNSNAQYYIEILTAWWRIAEQAGKEKAEKIVETVFRQVEKKNDKATIDSSSADRQLTSKISKKQSWFSNFVRKACVFKTHLKAA